MENVFFKPWVGAEYASGGIFGKRILVLGESHYTDGDPDPELTTKVLNEHLSYETAVPSYLQSFNKFERSLVGTATDGAARKRIWNSVVFYNYLQTPMSGPRQAGQKSDYVASAAAFFEVLERYRPEYVIVWGYRLWDALPADRWEWGGELSVDGKPVKIGCYLLADGTRIKTAPVKHPSAGYTWENWHRYLQSFLQCDKIVCAQERNDLGEQKRNIHNNNFEESRMVEEPSKFIDEQEDDIDMIRKVTYKELPSKVASELFVDEYNSSRLSTVIHSSYSENTTADVLLSKIGDAFSKSKISSEDEDEKGRNRTLCILDKEARIIELQHGELLVSIGLDTYCERKKTIRMQILNEPAERSFTDAPENIDYPVDAETFFDKKLLRWGLTGECVFSVENKERAKEPYILCQTCKGSGTIKCASCQGTGREQYVDGYFANGEERIKTGVCSDCQGSGRVTCPECEGDGKIEVFAPIYAVSKSVEEEISQVAFCAYAAPWNHYAESCYYSCSDPENDNDDREEPGLLLSQNIQEHLSRDGFFRISMKNRKEKLIDRADRVARAMKELNVSELYKQNENTIREWLKCYRRKNLICRKEQHYLLPISRLTVKISDENPKDIYVIPYDKNSTIAVMENFAYIGETGILKYLFYKLFK